MKFLLISILSSDYGLTDEIRIAQCPPDIGLVVTQEKLNSFYLSNISSNCTL